MRFIPFVGLGELNFGTSRERIRHILMSEGYREFKRNEFAENSTDYYQSLGLFMEFNNRDELEAIEIAEDSDVKILYDDKDLREYTFSELKKILDNKSKHKEEEGDIGITYHDLGISINKSSHKSKSTVLLLFSKDYW